MTTGNTELHQQTAWMLRFLQVTGSQEPTQIKVFPSPARPGDVKVLDSWPSRPQIRIHPGFRGSEDKMLVGVSQS